MKIKYLLTAFLLMALNSSVNAQDEFKFIIQEQPISCTASIFGGVHTCSQSLLAFAYNIPNKNDREAHFTCYVSWYYWVTGEGCPLLNINKDKPGQCDSVSIKRDAILG